MKAFERWDLPGIASLLAMLGIAGLAVIGVAGTVTSALDTDWDSRAPAYTALWLMALIAIVWLTWKRPEMGRRRYLVDGLVFLSGLALSLHMLARLHPDPVSDAANMHRLATAAAENGVWDYYRSYFGGIQDIEFRTGTDVLRQLILLYLVPAYGLFGPSELALKLVNLAFHFGTALVLYAYVRLVFRHERAAIFAVALMLLAPGFNSHLTLPSHEIPGLFYLSLVHLLHAHLLLALRQPGWRKPLVYAALFGVALIAVQLQRNFGQFALIALTIQTVFLVDWRALGQKAKQAAWLSMLRIVVVVVVIPLAILSVGNHYACATCRSQLAAHWLYWFGNSQTRDSSMDSAPYQASSRELEVEGLLGEYAIARTGSDLYQSPIAFGKAAAFKISRYGMIGDSQAWWFGGNKAQKAKDRRLIARYHPAEALHRIVLWGSVLSGMLVLAARASPANPWFFPMLMMCATVYSSVLGYSQVRYAHSNIFILAALGGVGLARGHELLGRARAEWSRVGLRIAHTLVTAVLVAGLATAAFVILWPKTKYYLQPLDRVQIVTEPQTKASGCSKRNRIACEIPIPKGFNGTLNAEWSLPRPADTPLVVQGILRAHTAVNPEAHMRLTAGGARVIDTTLAELGGTTWERYRYTAKWFSVTVPGSSDPDIQIQLTVEVPYSDSKRRGTVALDFVRILSARNSQ